MKSKIAFQNPFKAWVVSQRRQGRKACPAIPEADQTEPNVGLAAKVVPENYGENPMN
jgi:hypothetical protein